MFEAAVFYTLIGMGLFLLMASIKFSDFFRACLQFLGTTVFLLLAFVVLSGDDIAFVSVVSDGSNVLNQTNFVSGTEAQAYNTNANWLGIIFLLLGIIMAFMGFDSLTTLRKANQDN